MNKTNNNQIILFLRAPEKGKVKTRLARDLGEIRALELYIQFAESVLGAAQESGAGIDICFCPKDKLPLIESWLGKDHSFFPQTGKDLGERMALALAHVFDTGAEKAVLVGSDIPEIRAAHFAMAFEALDQWDMVIGPSMDGGYWLIGFNRQSFTPRLFQGIEWSTDSVCSATLDLAGKAGLSFQRLPVLRDVDTAKDLGRINSLVEDPGRMNPFS